MKLFTIRPLLLGITIFSLTLYSCRPNSQDKKSESEQFDLAGTFLFDTTISVPAGGEEGIILSTRRSKELVLEKDSTFNEINTIYMTADAPDYFGNWRIRDGLLELTRKGRLIYRHSRYLRTDSLEAEHFDTVYLEIISEEELKFMSKGFADDTLRKQLITY